MHKSHTYQSNVIDNSPERPPSEHVHRGPQPPESTAGQNQQDLTAGEASDSGDSLFITQKEIPRPVRSARRRRHGKRSGLVSSRCLQESEAESSSSSSPEDSIIPKTTTRKKSSLPIYTFSVLADNKSDGLMPSQKNKILHTFAVAGFFKCLSELDTKTSSPAVDADEEDISPLSEEEEEQSHTEGFRVVDKMCFATALKARSCRSWCSQRKQQKRMDAGCVAEKTLGENGLKRQENLPAEASTLTNVPLSEHRKSSGNAVHSSKVLDENEQDKPTQNTALKTKRCLTLGAEAASRDNNSSASVCEPTDVDGGGEVCSQTQREEMVDTQEHPTLLHTSPLRHSSHESICIGVRVKKRKKKKKIAPIHASMEGQRQEESAGVCLLEAVTLEVEPQAPQSIDEAESNERSLHDERTERQEERTSREHRKRKKRKTKTANSLWEEDLESDVTIKDSMISLEGGVKKDDDDDVRHSEQSSTTDGALNDAEGMKIKRKKREKDKKIMTADECEESVKSSEKDLALENGVELSYPKSVREVTNALEDSVANTKGSAEDKSPKAVKKEKQKHEVKRNSSEDSVPQSDFSVAMQKKEKRRTSSFLCADAVEKDVQTARKRISVQAEDLGTQSAEITENLAQSDGCVKAKKRKRKHDYNGDADTGVERKRDSERYGKGLGTATEMIESAAVLGPLKKKSREDSCCMSEEVSTHVGTFDRFFKQASYSQTPGKLAMKDKNRKMEPNSSAHLLQEELVTTATHLEFSKKKKECTAAPLTSEISFSKSEISSPDCVVSKKRQKIKRKLYHPVEDLLE